MKTAYRVLAALDGEVPRGSVERLLQDEPLLTLAGVAETDAAWAARHEHGADALLIVCTEPSDAVLELVAEAADDPRIPVIVGCMTNPNGFVRQVLQAGADDIVILDGASSGAELFFAIEKAVTRRSSPHGALSPGTGRLICVLGPKGGTGKTLTSANLAVALAQDGLRVALVDLDLQFGDLGLVLGIKPERSIYDLVVAGGSLDADKLDAFLAHGPAGVRVLLAPTRPDQASAVTPQLLKDVYPLLRDHFDAIVVDTPPGFTPEVIATIDAASDVCLLGTLDAPSLKNAKLGAETLELMGYPSERVRIVLNRADTNVGVSHADVVAVLGRAPDVLVPSHRDVVRSVNSGEPIVESGPRSEAAKAFRALAKLIAVETQDRAAVAPPAPARGRGLRVLGRS